jgi:hypothetical protein
MVYGRNGLFLNWLGDRNAMAIALVDMTVGGERTGVVYFICAFI